MTLKLVKAKIIGGTGGAEKNAIPIYADKNAPKGNWAYNATGGQLKLPNDTEVYFYDPNLITESDNAGNAFVTFTSDGEPFFIRFWLEGASIDWQRVLWGEYSHFSIIPTTQPPDPTPTPTPTGKKLVYKITIEEIQQ